VDSTRCEALAWSGADDIYDTHRDARHWRRQSCGVDGTGQRGTVPRPRNKKRSARPNRYHLSETDLDTAAAFGSRTSRWSIEDSEDTVMNCSPAQRTRRDHPRRANVLLTCAALLFVACGESNTAPVVETPPDTTTTNPPTATTPTLARSVLLTELSNPWDVAVAADGSIFFTERCLGLSVRHSDGRITRLFGTSGSSLVAADLSCLGQSGVNGVALDPEFASNRAIYVYMLSTLSGTPRTNRVVRVVLNEAYTVATYRTDIITDIPFKESGNAISGPGAHSGGRIRFGPDGFLYVTTGDNHNQALPQSPSLLGGKVLRVTSTGAPATGNAPPAGFDPRIFTFGHRNVQGIAFRPGTGQPYASEHGPNHSDEVTPLVNGGNSGWDPKDRPGLSCPGGYCGYAGNPSTMPMTDRTRFPNAMTPAWTNAGTSRGTGPAVFLAGTQWRSWNGRLAVGIMAGLRVVIGELDAGGNVTSTTDAPLPPARYRALTIGPDGNLYVATDAGEIWRVTPN
jgi:aldose sugar dehydrogenase